MNRTYQTEHCKQLWPPRPLLALLAQQGWEDQSWHNDACARWGRMGLTLWVEAKVPDNRECGGKRYTIVRTTETDDHEMLDFERTADLIAFLRRDVAVLGATFRSIIRQWLTQEQRLQVDAANDTKTDNSCATHNYCDSNMAMLEAFVAVHGREPVLQSDADIGLMNEAWGWAIDANFADEQEQPDDPARDIETVEHVRPAGWDAI